MNAKGPTEAASLSALDSSCYVTTDYFITLN